VNIRLDKLGSFSHIPRCRQGSAAGEVSAMTLRGVGLSIVIVTKHSLDPSVGSLSTRPVPPSVRTNRYQRATVEHHRGHADDRRGGGSCEFYRPAVGARIVCRCLACPDLQKTGVVRATVRMHGEPEKEASRASGSKRLTFGTLLSHLARPGVDPERGLSWMAELRSLERKP
jgi:hypothetical protein